MAHSKDLLKYTVDKSIDDAAHGLLTTCSDYQCIGEIIPQIKEKYPDTSVYIDFRSERPPTITFGQGRASLEVPAHFDIKVLPIPTYNITSLAGKSCFQVEKPKDAPVLSGVLKVSGAVKVSLTSNADANYIGGKVMLDRIQVMNSTSSVGDVASESLQGRLSGT